MRSSFFCTTLIAALLCPSFAFGQADKAAAADPKEHLDALVAGLKARKTNDEEKRDEAETAVVEALDALLLDYQNYDEKQQKKVVTEISKLFKVRSKEDENRLYIAAAACLSEMGPQGEKNLKSAMKVKSLEKRVDVQVMLIESLGKHRNPKNVDLFVDLMKKSEPKIVVASVKSLGEYRDFEAKLRKEISEELIKQYATANNLDLKEKGKNPVYHDRLLAMEVPMNEALAALTLQSFQSAPEWEKWFNDNRNRKW